MRGTMDATMCVDNLQVIPEKQAGLGAVAGVWSAPGRRRRSINLRRPPHAQPAGEKHV